jgi:hypothetical protein
MAGPRHYDPCISCGKGTSHASGKCQECRRRKCARCEKTFTPEKGRRNPEYCGRCESKVREATRRAGA